MQRQGHGQHQRHLGSPRHHYPRRVSHQDDRRDTKQRNSAQRDILDVREQALCLVSWDAEQVARQSYTRVLIKKLENIKV